MKQLNKIYRILLSEFGSQKWWPVTKSGELHPKYSGGPKNKNQKQQLEVIFGAILTQNTSWKNVEKAIHNLNKKDLIDAEKISKIKQSSLAKLIHPAGYYNQKAEKLKIFSNHLIKKYSNNLNLLFEKPIPILRAELLSIKGIGPETADSIILYSAKKPIFVIDAYTKRIFSRLSFLEEKSKYLEFQNLFHKNLKKNQTLFSEYHALIVELAKRNCRKNPDCDKCCLKLLCQYTIKK